MIRNGGTGFPETLPKKRVLFDISSRGPLTRLGAAAQVEGPRDFRPRVPTFVFENEPFLEQDRIELLIWRMESKGLTRHS